jgi:CheY-like chemotaxis protein
MRRRLPTGRIQAALIVDYADAEDFLADYGENLAHGRSSVEVARSVEVDSAIQLALSFPGLIDPIAVEGFVRCVENYVVEVSLTHTSRARLASMAERIRAKDRRVVVPALRVLIVEDNAHVSDLVKNGLAASTKREFRDVAFTFETALDGGIAMAKLNQTTFDALIVDVYLPVLDGSALIHHVRTSLGLTRIPIIGLSGGGDTARNAALRAGASAFLDKPVRLRHIVETMRTLIAM